MNVAPVGHRGTLFGEVLDYDPFFGSNIKVTVISHSITSLFVENGRELTFD
jgi:hypothetical protein